MAYINTLKEGDCVAVAQHGSWSVRNQGIYTVTKVDKAKVVVTRASDGYSRTFSAKSGDEKGATQYRRAFLEPVEVQQARVKQAQHTIAVRDAWAAVEQAAHNKSLADTESALAAVKTLMEGGAA